MASPAGGGQADVVYPQFFADHMRISTLCAEGVALLEAHPEAAPAYWTQLLHFGLKLGQFLSLGVPPRIFVFSHPLSGSGFPFRSLTGSFFFLRKGWCTQNNDTKCPELCMELGT